MKQRSAIRTDLFAAEHHREKIDRLGDPLSQIEAHIDFIALAAEVDRIAARPVSAQGGRPPFPTETMVRIGVLKRLYNLSDEQMQYQLLDRMSYQHFCALDQAVSIPDRTHDLAVRTAHRAQDSRRLVPRSGMRLRPHRTASARPARRRC